MCSPILPGVRLAHCSATVSDCFRSGDAVFAFDDELVVRSWNAAAERLTGIPAAEAVGRRCWEVLRGVDERGSLVCHAGCSGARLAREGWPLPARTLLVGSNGGRKRVSVSTLAFRPPAGEPLTLHLLRNGEAVQQPPREAPMRLTPRQLEVLRLLAEGLPTKVVALRLGLAQVTVRNHVQAILTELRCHSQLEAVAKARRSGLL